MLTLFLLRHAKSSWSDDTLDDFDRPLNNRGREAAPAIGAYMRRHGLSPRLILCSGAWRTRETLGLVLPWLRGEAEIRLENGLYDADDGADLLHRVQSVGSHESTLMLIAHNPAVEDLATMLCASGPEEDMASMRRKFPTAGLAVIDFESSGWKHIGKDIGTLRSFVVPRDLNGS